MLLLSGNKQERLSEDVSTVMRIVTRRNGTTVILACGIAMSTVDVLNWPIGKAPGKEKITAVFGTGIKAFAACASAEPSMNIISWLIEVMLRENELCVSSSALSCTTINSALSGCSTRPVAVVVRKSIVT